MYCVRENETLDSLFTNKKKSIQTMEKYLMNSTTFGKSDSAIKLAEILDQHPTYRKRVSAMLQEQTTVNKEIVGSNLSYHLKKSFLMTTLERFKSKGNNLDVKEVQTFTLNVIKQNHRKSLNQI